MSLTIYNETTYFSSFSLLTFIEGILSRMSLNSFGKILKILQTLKLAVLFMSIHEHSCHICCVLQKLLELETLCKKSDLNSSEINFAPHEKDLNKVNKDWEVSELCFTFTRENVILRLC